MAKQNPQSMPTQGTISLEQPFLFKSVISVEDTVPVKDSTIYKIQKWEYLVKKQTGNSDESQILMLLDELATDGWELINRQPANHVYYIFKKLSKK
jgi:hypothetical protein